MWRPTKDNKTSIQDKVKHREDDGVVNRDEVSKV